MKGCLFASVALLALALLIPGLALLIVGNIVGDLAGRSASLVGLDVSPGLVMAGIGAGMLGMLLVVRVVWRAGLAINPACNTALRGFVLRL